MPAICVACAFPSHAFPKDVPPHMLFRSVEWGLYVHKREGTMYTFDFFINLFSLKESGNQIKMKKLHKYNN
jgi:hypothetical protein